MGSVTWEHDRQVRKGLFAVILKDSKGQHLARVSQSSDTFARVDQYSMTIQTPEGVGLMVTTDTWGRLRVVLDRNLPDLDLSTLDLPEHTIQKRAVSWR